MKTQPITPYLIPTNTLEGALFIDHTGKLIVNPKSNIQFRDCKYQHLYLTNGDEIKEGDWYLYLTIKGWEVYKADANFGTLSVGSKKIILTTDPKLIADGVIGIDGNTKAHIEHSVPIWEIVSFLYEFCERFNNQKDAKKVDVEKEFYEIISSQRGSLPVQWKLASEKCFKIYSNAIQSVGSFSLEQLKDAMSKLYLTGEVNMVRESDAQDILNHIQSLASSKGEIVIGVEVEEFVYDKNRNETKNALQVSGVEYKIKLTNGQPTLILK